MKHKKLVTVFGVVVAGLTPLGLLGCGRGVKQQNAALNPGAAFLNRAAVLNSAYCSLTPALDSLTQSQPSLEPALSSFTLAAAVSPTMVLEPSNKISSFLARYLTSQAFDNNFWLAPFNRMSRKPGVAFPKHGYTPEIIQASEVMGSPAMVQHYLARQKYVINLPHFDLAVTVWGQPVIKSVRASDKQGTLTFNLNLTCPQVGMVVPVVVPNLVWTGWLKNLVLTPANLSKEVWYDYESPGYGVIHVREGVTSLQPNLWPGDLISVKGVPYTFEANRLILPTTIRHVARGVFGAASKPKMPDYLRFRGAEPLCPLDNPKLITFAQNAFVGSDGNIAISYVDSGLPGPATTNWQKYITRYFKDAFA